MSLMYLCNTWGTVQNSVLWIVWDLLSVSRFLALNFADSVFMSDEAFDKRSPTVCLGCFDPKVRPTTPSVPCFACQWVIACCARLCVVVNADILCAACLLVETSIWWHNENNRKTSAMFMDMLCETTLLGNFHLHYTPRALPLIVLVADVVVAVILIGQVWPQNQMEQWGTTCPSSVESFHVLW